MTRILFAWEMGNNYGHLGTIAPLLPSLRQADATVFLALQNPQAIGDIPVDPEIQVIPAPFVKPTARHPQSGPILNYADDIALCGYNSVQTLSVLLRCWYAIYDLVMPDLVVTETAPTAQLAARRSNIPVFALGTGYDLPPLTAPMPGLLKDANTPTDELRKHEDRVLSTINQALESLHQPKLSRFADLLQSDAQALTTLPELDHYGARDGANYVGPLLSGDNKAEPTWPDNMSGPRIFAYLRPAHPLFLPMLHILRQSSCSALVVAPGCPEKIQAEFATIPHIRLQTTPVHMEKAIAESDVVISHASHGTSASALLGGRPLLLLPGHLEQLMLAQRIVAQKLGLMVHINGTAAQIQHAFRALLDDPSFRTQAQAFQKRYLKSSGANVTQDLAAAILKCAKADL